MNATSDSVTNYVGQTMKSTVSESKNLCYLLILRKVMVVLSKCNLPIKISTEINEEEMSVSDNLYL